LYFFLLWTMSFKPRVLKYTSSSLGVVVLVDPGSGLSPPWLMFRLGMVHYTSNRPASTDVPLKFNARPYKLNERELEREEIAEKHAHKNRQL